MRFILITALLLIALTTRAQQAFNGNFESLGANGKPAGWNMAFTGSPSYKTKLDSTTKRQGKYSVSIAYDTGKVSYEAIIFPIKQHFVGRSLTLIGHIKTENVVGDAGLFLGINGAGGQIAAANMHDQKLSGTHDWKEYYIQLNYNEGDAISLDAGAYLMGTGKIWVDSLRLYMDETPIAKAPIATFKALKDTAFANGSGISSLPTGKASVKNLTLLGQLWGFLKYHHPAIARGDYDWDNELFRLLPQFTKLSTNAQISALLEKWVDGLGKVQPCTTCKPMANQKDIAVRPNYGNLFNNPVFTKSLKQKLKYILANHDSTYNYYIRLPFIPSFTHEKVYDTLYPDAGYRLLALLRYWNIIQYFSPNRTLISEGWSNMLPQFIPQFAGARNKTEYALAVNKLIAHVHDGHAFIISSAIGEYQGNYRLPVAARFVEGKLVVVGYYKDTLEAKKLFKPGDVITEINGQRVSRLVQKYLPLMSSSNMAGKLRDMPGFYLLRSKQKLFDLTLLRDDQTMHIKATAADASQINDYNWSAHPKTAGYALINKDIGYIYPALYKNSMLDDIKKTFKNTKGIIIDMRCYPGDDMDQTIGNYIKPFNSAFVTFTHGSLKYPGLFTYYKPETTGKKSPDNYKGKVVVIVNEITQSNAEFVTMAFQTSPNVTVIGSTTAGADGNITPINLPGKFSTYISGLGVYYPDGTNAQRKGVKIDMVVRPTIKGIRENRDEVLERAKALID